MGTYRESSSSRSRSITGKVTATEEAEIKAYAATCGTDVSTLTRELWLAELESQAGLSERQASVQMLELFKRTMRASLAQGDDFGVAEFDALCAEVNGVNGVEHKSV